MRSRLLAGGGARRIDSSSFRRRKVWCTLARRKISGKSLAILTASDASSLDRLREVFGAAAMLAEPIQFAGVVEIRWEGQPCWASPSDGGNLIRLHLPMGTNSWNRLTQEEKLTQVNRINAESKLLRASVAEDGILVCCCELPVFCGITAEAVVKAARCFIEQLKSASAFLDGSGEGTPEGKGQTAGLPKQVLRGPPVQKRSRRAATRQTAGLPKQVLRGVHWSFIGKPFADREAFDQAVRQYQIDIGGKDTWRPEEVVIPYPHIRVAYMCWQADEQIEPVIELASDADASFTAGEILFKLHNAVVEQLREIDHHFFEGLGLDSHQAAGESPLYVLDQGS